MKLKSLEVIFLASFFSLVEVQASEVKNSDSAVVTSEEKIAVPERERPPIGEGIVYTLGKEDIIEIMVRNQPEFSGKFIVGPDGKIQYTFVGDIQAEGLTKEELKKIITERLKKYVKIPEVSIAIVSYRSKNVYIFGAVRKPGKYPLKGDSISLRDAIVEAGLPIEDAALRRVYVIKLDKGKPTYKKVDLVKLLYKGQIEENIQLTSGDVGDVLKFL